MLLRCLDGETHLANRDSSLVLPVTRSCCSCEIMVSTRTAAMSCAEMASVGAIESILRV